LHAFEPRYSELPKSSLCILEALQMSRNSRTCYMFHFVPRDLRSLGSLDFYAGFWELSQNYEKKKILLAS